MKNKVLILVLIVVTFLLTGCLKTDDMDEINIITTNYAIEYATNRLYKENSTITNIYPNGVNRNEYKFTDKQLQDFSKRSDLLIYDGNTDDKDDALKMLKYNKGLKIIDATYQTMYTYRDSDLWLNPSEYLMLIQNIKNELQDYITDPYLIKDLDTRYETLKIDITSLDSSLNQAGENSVNKSIVCIDETLLFLKRYGFEVINLTEDGKEKPANIDIAKNLMDNKKVNYIFVTDENTTNNITEELISAYNLKKATFKTLKTLSEQDSNNNEDYLTIMNNNINLITQETYE